MALPFGIQYETYTTPAGYTDNFSSPIHGPDLANHPKSELIKLAELLASATSPDSQVRSILKMAPCRVLSPSNIRSSAQITIRNIVGYFHLHFGVTL